MLDLIDIEKETDRRHESSRAAAFAHFASIVAEGLARVLIDNMRPYVALEAMEARMKRMNLDRAEKSRNAAALRGFFGKLPKLINESHLIAFDLAETSAEFHDLMAELLRSMQAPNVRLARGWCMLNQVEPLTEQQIAEIRACGVVDQQPDEYIRPVQAERSEKATTGSPVGIAATAITNLEADVDHHDVCREPAARRIPDHGRKLSPRPHFLPIDSTVEEQIKRKLITLRSLLTTVQRKELYAFHAYMMENGIPIATVVAVIERLTAARALQPEV